MKKILKKKKRKRIEKKIEIGFFLLVRNFFSFKCSLKPNNRKTISFLFSSIFPQTKHSKKKKYFVRVSYILTLKIEVSRDGL